VSEIRLRRVYDAAAADDGFRVLVDRLWPRGVSKERAALDLWAKEVAPSPELRRDWHAHPERWDDFVTRYRHELDISPALESLRAELAARPVVTLVYGSRDEARNHALVLAERLR
jgi:uncharacterized protein YeaO (DUF488 family)